MRLHWKSTATGKILRDFGQHKHLSMCQRLWKVEEQGKVARLQQILVGRNSFFFPVIWSDVFHVLFQANHPALVWLIETENEGFFYWLYKRPFCGCGFPVYRVQPHLGNTQLSGEKTSQTPCLSATQHAAIKNTWGHHPLFCLRMVKSALS